MASHKYSEHFKNELLKVYPTDTKMHEALGKHEKHIGVSIKTNAEQSISPDFVLTSTIEAIRDKANFIKQNILLYNLWHDEVKHWH